MTSAPAGQPSLLSAPAARIHSLLLLASCLAAFLCAALMGYLYFKIARGDAISVRGAETNVVFSVQQSLLGRPLYGDPAQPPFTITQYSPLYYWLLTGACKATGVTWDDPVAITRLGRAISLVFALLQLFTVALILKCFRVRWPLILIACCWAVVYQVPWVGLCRPDALLAFATTACVGCAAAMMSERLPRAQILLAILGVALFGWVTLLSKQTGGQIVAIVGSFLFLVAIRNKPFRSRLATLVLACAAPAVALILWLSLHREQAAMMKLNLLDGVRNGVNIISAVKKTYAPFFSIAGVLLIAYLFACLQFLNRKPWDLPRLMLAYSAAGLFVIATFFGLKMGSTANYYHEFSVVAAMAVAIALNEFLFVEQHDFAARRFTHLALLAATAVVMPGVAMGHYIDYGWSLSSYGPVREVAEAMRAELDQHPGALVVCSLKDPNPSKALTGFLADRAILPHMDISELVYETGAVNYANLKKRVDDGTIRYCVVEGEAPPRDMLGVSFGHFQLLRRVGNYRVLVNPASENAEITR